MDTCGWKWGVHTPRKILVGLRKGKWWWILGRPSPGGSETWLSMNLWAFIPQRWGLDMDVGQNPVPPVNLKVDGHPLYHMISRFWPIPICLDMLNKLFSFGPPSWIYLNLWHAFFGNRYLELVLYPIFRQTHRFQRSACQYSFNYCASSKIYWKIPHLIMVV